jgi:hypothetical protein
VVTAPKLLQPVAGTSQHKAANCRLDWLSDVVAADAVSSVVGSAAALMIPAAVRIVTGRLLQVEAEGNRIEVDRE